MKEEKDGQGEGKVAREGTLEFCRETKENEEKKGRERKCRKF